MSKASEFYVMMPVPVSRVPDVYALLAETPSTSWAEDLADDVIGLLSKDEQPARKRQQCSKTKTIAGVKVRCQRGPRHNGQRHQWKED
jgi:hypothetical protein